MYRRRGFRIGLRTKKPGARERILQPESSIEQLCNAITSEDASANTPSPDSEAGDTQKNEPVPIENLCAEQQHENSTAEDQCHGNGQLFDAENRKTAHPSGLDNRFDTARARVLGSGQTLFRLFDYPMLFLTYQNKPVYVIRT